MDQLQQFIDELIGSRAAELAPDDLAELKRELEVEIDDAINRAILNRLSDEALQEIEAHLEDDPATLSQLILNKAEEAQLDLNAITAETLLRIKALYSGEVLVDDIGEGDAADEASAEAA